MTGHHRAGPGSGDRSVDDRPVLVHLTTTDMSLDWLLAPQLVAFADAGYRVIGMSAPGPHVPHLAELGIEHVALPAFTRSTDPLQDVRAFAQLCRALRRLRPDIVHTHNPKPGILGRIAARLTGVPLVVNTQHGLYAQPSDRRRRRWPVYAAERFAAAFGQVELVQNPEDVTTLVRVLRVPERKVRLLGNGVDLTRFDPDRVPTGARERLRNEWGIGVDDVVVVGTVGRLVAEKGIAELLDAAHRVRTRLDLAGAVGDAGAEGASGVVGEARDAAEVGGVHGAGVGPGAGRRDVRFVIVGPTDEGKADAVDTATRSRAETDGVVFTGQRTDMPECYAAMDVFVTASWREGFPRSAMEAAAMGLPIVGTDIRGTRQVVDDGVTGVLVPVRSPEPLADAIASVVADAERRRAMSSAARARARAEFDQQRVIDRTLAAYELLGDRRHRRRRR